METSSFEKLVDKHSLQPGDILYNGNALAGEVGEVCNMIKKIKMAEIKPEWITQSSNQLPTPEEHKVKLIDELGDALFYLVRVARDNDVTLDELMLMQSNKLEFQTIKYKRTFLK